MAEPTDATRRFATLADRFLAEDGVSEGTGFGSTPGLRVQKKIFAMLTPEGGLVVKLPKARVDGLVGAGVATRFDPRRDGRLMREWAVVPPEHARRWEALAAEALEFVRPRSR